MTTKTSINFYMYVGTVVVTPQQPYITPHIIGDPDVIPQTEWTR